MKLFQLLFGLATGVCLIGSSMQHTANSTLVKGSLNATKPIVKRAVHERFHPKHPQHPKFPRTTLRATVATKPTKPFVTTKPLPSTKPIVITNPAITTKPSVTKVRTPNV
jgi:hypothetical protein